jgi:hypothetical protein
MVSCPRRRTAAVAAAVLGRFGAGILKTVTRYRLPCGGFEPMGRLLIQPPIAGSPTTRVALPVGSVIQGGLDPCVDPIPITVEALGVDLEQDIDGVPSALSDAGSWDVGIAAEQRPGMTQVVESAGVRPGPRRNSAALPRQRATSANVKVS